MRTVLLSSAEMYKHTFGKKIIEKQYLFPMVLITVALMFVLGTVLSYLISKYILRKIPVARKIMLGDWK